MEVKWVRMSETIRWHRKAATGRTRLILSGMVRAAAIILIAGLGAADAKPGEQEEAGVAAHDSARERFAASRDGQRLYSAFYAAQMRMFTKNHPSRSPSETVGGEERSAAQARCMVRRISLEDPDHVTADERAAIEMLIRDVPAGLQIEDPAVGRLYGAVYSSCAQNPNVPSEVAAARPNPDTAPAVAVAPSAPEAPANALPEPAPPQPVQPEAAPEPGKGAEPTTTEPPQEVPGRDSKPNRAWRPWRDTPLGMGAAGNLLLGVAIGCYVLWGGFWGCKLIYPRMLAWYKSSTFFFFGTSPIQILARQIIWGLQFRFWAIVIGIVVGCLGGAFYMQFFRRRPA